MLDTANAFESEQANHSQKTIDLSLVADGTAMNIDVSLIDDFPNGNIRKKRDPVAFEDLRNAIRRDGGITQAMTIRAHPDNACRAQLLAGYGRRAVALADNHVQVPVVVKVADDKQALSIMLSENAARESLSIADEIIMAQRFSSLYDGDHTKAAADLGWSEKRYRGRLLLNSCVEEVIDALRDKQIKIGHAEILSQFSEKIQEGTLKRIVKEGLTVEQLKALAGVATKKLSEAKFDQSECEGCQHNSQRQASLFDNSVGSSKCGNLVCYKSKTEAWLENHKQELKIDYHTVLLDIEKPKSDRNTLTEDDIGAKQLEQGCKGCVSNAAIITSSLDRHCGTVMDNQCIDSDCFRKMVAANKQENEKQHARSNDANKGQTVAETAGSKVGQKNKVQPKKDSKVVTQKKPNIVIENNKNMLRELAVEQYASEPHFIEAISVSSLIEKAGIAQLSEKWLGEQDVIPENMSLGDFATRTLFLYQLDKCALNAIKSKASLHFMRHTNSQANSFTSPRAFMIQAIALKERAIPLATEYWAATEEYLSGYLKGGVEVLAKKSGFIKAYDESKGEGAFSRLSKRSKPDLIKGILEFDFDWSEFAPYDYLELIART